MSLGERIDEFVATEATAEADLYGSRREWKHVVDAAAAARLRAVVAAHLPREEFVAGRPVTLVHSIYLDDAAFGLYRQCLESDRPNLKFRVRTYANPDGSGADASFVEFKAGVIEQSAKRKRKERVKLSAARLEALFRADAPWVDTDKRRWHALQTFVRAHGLAPKLTVSYHREAFVEGPVRITFDVGYQASAIMPDTSSPIDARPATLDGRVVIEVKHLDGLPDWFVAALETEGLDPVGQSFSKYKTAVAMLYGPAVAAPAIAQAG
jgi:SPX domain protein involved in polyphosphate accumulation